MVNLVLYWKCLFLKCFLSTHKRKSEKKLQLYVHNDKEGNTSIINSRAWLYLRSFENIHALSIWENLLYSWAQISQIKYIVMMTKEESTQNGKFQDSWFRDGRHSHILKIHCTFLYLPLYIWAKIKQVTSMVIIIKIYVLVHHFAVLCP